MKYLTLIAALIAGPAFSLTDAEIETRLKSMCGDLSEMSHNMREIMIDDPSATPNDIMLASAKSLRDIGVDTDDAGIATWLVDTRDTLRERLTPEETKASALAKCLAMYGIEE